MARYFLFNLMLAVVFVLLTGDVTLSGVLLGLVIGWGVVQLASLPACGGPRGLLGPGSYNRRLWGLITFSLYFTRILIQSNFLVAWEILTPGYQMQPRIIRYCVEGLTQPQITVLTSAITLTPGTLVCDIDDAGTHLLIHCMYALDKERAVADLDHLRSRLMKEVFGA